MDRPHLPVAILAALLVVALALAAGVAAGVDRPVLGDGTPADDDTSAVLGDDTPALDTTGEESAYLSAPPEEVTREEYTQAGIDLSAAAATDAQRLRGSHSVAAFEERFEGGADRQVLVEDVAADIAERAEALDAHHAQLLAAYSDGERSADRLLRELAWIGAAADQHRALADRVETAAAGADAVNLSEETQRQFVALDVEIPALESPVTDALVAGDLGSGTSVYVQTTGDAIVLAAPGETYTRQATLRGERNESAPNQFIEEAGEDENPNSLALERAEELYPGLEVFSPPPLDATSVYGTEGTTAVGSFTAYLDGATRNVFHEQQLADPDTVPVSETVSNSTDGVELTVETTTATGPMRVTVTADGEPVEGTPLRVASAAVGTTDAAGQRWVVQPLDGAVVSATVDGETVSVTLP